MTDEISPKATGLCIHIYDGTDVKYVGPGVDHRLPVDVEAIVLPADAATETTLASILLELADKLNTADLNIDAAKDLQVDVKTSALPSGAGTAANQTTMITALQLIDDLRNALGSVNTDDLQVDVKTSALPTGAATAANQTTMITALQLIDDLRNALGSVNTDDLQVDIKTYPGSNALGNIPWGYYNRWAERVFIATATTGTNILATDAVPAGYVYIVQVVSCTNVNSASTQIRIQLTDGTVVANLLEENTPVAERQYSWSGEATLKAGDIVRVRFTGCTAGDDLYLQVWGYKMLIA